MKLNEFIERIMYRLPNQKINLEKFQKGYYVFVCGKHIRASAKTLCSLLFVINNLAEN